MPANKKLHSCYRSKPKMFYMKVAKEQILSQGNNFSKRKSLNQNFHLVTEIHTVCTVVSIST